MKFTTMKKIPLFALLALWVLNSYSQYEDHYWEPLYADESVTVEVSFHVSPTPCKGSNNKFSYRVSGSLSRKPKYVNWKMVYRDCNSQLVYLLHSVSIGKDAVLEKTIELPEFFFSGVWLVDKFKIYKPTVANHPYIYMKPQPLPYDWGIGILSAIIKGREKICGGESVYLLATVLDTTSAVLYQWQSSVDGNTWKNLPGQTKIDCRTEPIENSTYFRCVCKDEATGMVLNSNSLLVSVIKPTVIISGNSSVCTDGTVNLSASAYNAVSGATYHWLMSHDKDEWIDTFSNTTAGFVSPPLQNETYFRCLYKPGSGYCKETTSDIFTVVINPGTTVSAQGDTTICSGANLELTSSLTAQSTPGTYQWQSTTDKENWTNLHSGVWEKYSTAALFSTTRFRVLFTPQVSGCVASVSNEVLVNVIQLPLVTAMGNKTIHTEKSVPLKVKGAGDAEANYQWQESSNQKSWKDIVGGISAKITTPLITSTTYYRCVYRPLNTGCEGVSNVVTVSMPENQAKVIYSDEKIWVTRLHNPKKLLHVGIDAGFGFFLQPLPVVSQQFPDSYVSALLKALGLHAGFLFHPVIKDFASLGFSVSGDVGTTPLLFAGGKAKTNGTAITEKYLASKFNFGTEVAFGYWALKFLMKYNVSMQSHKFTRTQNDGTNLDVFSANQTLRKEIIGAGFRVGPYSARKRANIPYNLDFLVTVANDYRFNWSGMWTYQSISGWQLGVEADVWLQSCFKLGFGVNFYDGGKNYIFPETKNHTTAFVSLTYARDWFK